MYGSHQGQNGSGRDGGDDYETIRLCDQLHLHTRHTPHFMASRVDIYIRERLRPLQSTKLALLSRLLERGTRTLPTMRALNRFTDGLFGAAYVGEIDQFGDTQTIHLGLEVLDSSFLPDRSEDLLSPGLDFLRDVLLDPFREPGSGFPRATVEREKRALDRQLLSLMNDKSAYAQRRCTEEMCREEAYGIFAWGDRRDLETIDGQALWTCHRELLTAKPVDIFFSSRQPVDAATVAAFERRFTWHDRQVELPRRVDEAPPAPVSTREVIEAEDLSQGRLVLGLRTSIDISDARFPALVVLNHVLGSDGHSRLHRNVREEAGLCYHVGSFLEPLCRLLFVEAGIDVRYCDDARRRIEGECQALAEDGPGDDELARTKAHLTQRLRALDDDREALIRFFLARRIGETDANRPLLARRIEAVTTSAVREAARSLLLDTVYLLGGNHDAVAAC